MRKKLIFAALAILSQTSTCPVCVRALELLLEENRGESGTVGYVDIDRVFKEFSGTLNAREEFISEIKKKEEAIGRRKTALYTLKAEIAKLRQEREFALTLPGLLKTREQIEEEATTLMAAAAAVAGAAASLQPVQTSSPAVTASTDTAAVAGSTASAQAVQASSSPAVSPENEMLETRREAAPSTAAAALSAIAIDMPGVSGVPAGYFKFSVSTSVPEIDAAITAREAELRDKEDSLKLYQRQTEVELLEYESRKSELILGRIYLVLKELAVKEAVSVIVDKRNILFGHSAVDLTDKLLKKLEENPV